MMSTIWKPKDVSAYQRMVRTNNDLEGYHRKLNKRCVSDHPPIYKLLEVLYDEARLVDFTYKAISSAHVAMIRRKKSRETQAKVQNVWDDYAMGVIDAGEFVFRLGPFWSHFLGQFAAFVAILETLHMLEAILV